MVAESWFRSLWRNSKKYDNEAVIGVLAFEVASLMSKLVHIWKILSDKQLLRLREDISNSVGIKKLISDDDDYVVMLLCAEIIENMGHVARSVARLGKKCSDPGLKSFEHLFNDLIKIGFDPKGWEFSWKKMEKKMKKMERLISLNASLYQEIEILSELEQTLKRMKGNNDTDGMNVVEFEKKFIWKKQEVKNLKDASLWNKTYDYTVLLLSRSLFTIFGRVNHVFGINQNLAIEVPETRDSNVMNSDYYNDRNPSLATLMQFSDNPVQFDRNRFSSGPMAKSIMTQSGPLSRTVKSTNNFYSGPLGNSSTKSGPIPLGTKKNFNFFSGPLGKPKTKVGPLSGTSKTIQKLWQRRDNPTFFQSKDLKSKHKQLEAPPFMVKDRNLYLSSNGNNNNTEELANQSVFDSKRRLLNAPHDTLGGAALALHYANIIIIIEKLVASPHLIGHDARDDLYSMLPSRVKTALRERLKPYAKSLASSIYDTTLAEEWNDAIRGILEWLAPLAHNMIRWQSERSFEQQNFVSRTNVFLVQTLYFANQEKTEATITELLVGLNYIWRFGRELNAKALLECASSKIYDDYVDIKE